MAKLSSFLLLREMRRVKMSQNKWEGAERMPRYYFAPMEGITGRLFRRRHRQFFSGVDLYFAPFLSPNQHHVFSTKELGDVLPEYNEGIPLVPQILTKRAEDFLWCAGELAAMGYRRVDLNLGCPSGTVTAKGKGSGMLEDLRTLESFLEEIFAASPVAISVKTRLGLVEEEEFEAILEVYNRFPITELTIHPRVQKDFYKGNVRMDAFEKALRHSKNPVCYNGDLITAAQCSAFAAAHESVGALMIGRGMLRDPALAQTAKGGAALEKEKLEAFCTLLYEDYCEAFHSGKNALRPMKELWFYLLPKFENSEKLGKQLKKSSWPEEYRAVVTRIFRELELKNR